MLAFSLSAPNPLWGADGVGIGSAERGAAFFGAAFRITALFLALAAFFAGRRDAEAFLAARAGFARRAPLAILRLLTAFAFLAGIFLRDTGFFFLAAILRTPSEGMRALLNLWARTGGRKTSLLCGE